ncbi:MAG: PAS domain S-box protein, partial [Rhodospirillaceae bacterium]|nr:PAS domain S-box protein [Rhodospirillaceae bacterium]
DARSVILSLAGLFGGPVIGVIAGGIAGGYRLWLGGGGAAVGVAVIISCVLLGLAYRHAVQRSWLRIDVWRLLAFGLLVHLAEIFLFTFLPAEIMAKVMESVAIPLVLTFTPATALLGALLQSVETQIQADRLLGESEARFRDIAEVAGDWIWETDSSLRYTFFSPRFFELFPFEADSIIGKTRAEYTGANRDDKHWRDHLDDLENRKPFRGFEYSFAGPDSQTKHIRISGKPVFGADGEFRGYRGAGTDITAHINAMEALRNSERRFRTVVDNLPVGVNLKDMDGRYLLVNKVLEGWHGFSEKELLGKTASEMIDEPEVTQAARLRQEQELLKTGAPAVREEERRRATGVTQFAVINKFPISDAHGTLIGFGTATIDITEYRQAEEALREREMLLRSIIDNAPALLNLKDLDGRYLLVNEAFARSRDRSPASMVGTKSHDSISKTHADTAMAHHDVTVANRATTIEERESILPNGSSLQVLVTKFPVFDVDGNLTSIGSFSIDISELKSAEIAAREALDEAREADRAKQDFLANMSHELRTPLNAIMGFSEVMQLEMFGELANDRYREYLTDIFQSSKHLLALVNDILDLSKIEAGKLELSISDIDIADVASAAVRELQGQMRQKSLRFSMDIDRNAATFRADRLAVRQMLTNLLSNAVKFTPENGEITLTVSADGSHSVKITVSDTGVGIPESDLEKILTPFGQSGAIELAREGGIGLGLPIVTALAKLHAGAFEIESVVGAGTHAHITLPVAPPPTAPDANAPAP